MQIGFLILLFILGACIGSFLCCSARRLHFRQAEHRSLGKRSVCLSCHHQLKWYDNLPIISWILLKGKCRKCHQKIGLAEFLSEVGTAFAFVALGATIDIETAGLLAWLTFASTVMLAIVLIFLAIFDGLYGELPTLFLILAIICGFVILILKECLFFTLYPLSELIWQPILSTLILGGLYLVLYLISKGKWVGDGDWLLGTAIGLALFNPWLAVITLFVSNTLAFFVMYPKSKKNRRFKIYFGPFLVVAFIIVCSLSDQLLSLIP
ncbi:prepilin peptidase [Candidatus Saccharibacteria bacterium]|nr:prepilin peptidase [Candidatus Saccharibacteria bacterium]